MNTVNNDESRDKRSYPSDLNYEIMYECESGNEHELPFPKENPLYLEVEMENVMSVSTFWIDPFRKITFEVSQNHDIMDTQRDILKDYSF